MHSPSTLPIILLLIFIGEHWDYLTRHTAKTLVEGSNSCGVTRSTVQYVNDCPDSEESWREAAVRKKCDVPAKQCSEPERLVYHCVINPFVNQIIEVCAYAQNIVGGQCTSYDISGNVIQENWRADCSKFKENACPLFYRSDYAYKYPGCYNLTKKLTAGTNNPLSTSHPDTAFVSTTLSSNMLNFTDNHVEMPKTEEKMDTNTATVIGIILGVLFAVTVTFIFIVFVVRKRYQKDSRRRQPLEIAKPDEDRLLNA